MKSHHKKLLVRLLLLVGMLAVTIGPSLAYYGNLRIVGLSSEPEIVEENVSPVFSVPLSDLYGRAEGYDLSQFMGRENVLSDLIEINNTLHNSDVFEYYQVTEPSIYYVGNYQGKQETIVAGEEYRNQVDTETRELITSLNSFEISKNIADQIADQTVKGQAFSDGDFSLTCKDEIPVVIGSAFEENLSVGDILNIRYYLANIRVKIVGIMKKGASLKIPNMEMNLDGYMVFPDIKIDRENLAAKKHNIIMMLEKDEGYIGIYKLKDFEKVIEELNRISKKYNFALDIESIENTYTYLKGEKAETVENDKEHNVEEKEINIDNSMSRKITILLYIVSIIGAICILIIAFFWKRVFVDVKVNYRGIVFKTRETIKFISNIMASYIISYSICALIFGRRYENFDYHYIAYPQSWVRLFLMCIIIMGSMILCRQIGKSMQKEEEPDD